MKNKLKNMKRKNAGFTLLELVVVVAVMGLISSMAMDVYTDNSNQKRFETTKERLAEIKFATIGDPMMRVGSQAVLSGFFNDMGRLPRNLKELITPKSGDFCLHDTDYSVNVTAVTPSACAAITVGSWSWTTDDSTNWNGPYLHNIQSVSNNQVFGDVWGSDNGTDTDNFGWIFDISTGNLVVESFGLDRADGNTTGGYEVDQYVTINKAELDRIMQLKGLVASSGYCVVIATEKLDLNFITKPLCEANNPALPTVATHIWATFS